MARVYGTVGGSISDVTSFTKEALDAGLAGERAVAKRIEQALADNNAIEIHHSVKIPGTEFDADHAILIGSHLIIVDSKMWKHNHAFRFSPVEDGLTAVERRPVGFTPSSETDEGWERFLSNDLHIQSIARVVADRLKRQGAEPKSYQVVLCITSPGAQIEINGELSEEFSVATIDTIGEVIHKGAVDHRMVAMVPDYAISRVLQDWNHGIDEKVAIPHSIRERSIFGGVLETSPRRPSEVVLADTDRFLERRKKEEEQRQRNREYEQKRKENQIWREKKSENMRKNRELDSFKKFYRGGFFVALVPTLFCLMMGIAYPLSLVIQAVGVVFGLYILITGIKIQAKKMWVLYPINLILFFWILVLTL